jgi:hypothetical protein
VNGNQWSYDLATLADTRMFGMAVRVDDYSFGRAL